MIINYFHFKGYTCPDKCILYPFHGYEYLSPYFHFYNHDKWIFVDTIYHMSPPPITCLAVCDVSVIQSFGATLSVCITIRSSMLLPIWHSIFLRIVRPSIVFPFASSFYWFLLVCILKAITAIISLARGFPRHKCLSPCAQNRNSDLPDFRRKSSCFSHVLVGVLARWRARPPSGIPVSHDKLMHCLSTLEYCCSSTQQTFTPKSA